MTTIDILISLAAERIGCPIAQKPVADEHATRVVIVTSGTGTDTEVEIAADTSFDDVVALLLAGYNAA